MLKVGDKVVVVDYSYYRLYKLIGTIQAINLDVFWCSFGYNDHPTPIEIGCVVSEEIYNSPLYKAMSED